MKQDLSSRGESERTQTKKQTQETQTEDISIVELALAERLKDSYLSPLKMSLSPKSPPPPPVPTPTSNYKKSMRRRDDEDEKDHSKADNESLFSISSRLSLQTEHYWVESPKKGADINRVSKSWRRMLHPMNEGSYESERKKDTHKPVQTAKISPPSSPAFQEDTQERKSREIRTSGRSLSTGRQTRKPVSYRETPLNSKVRKGFQFFRFDDVEEHGSN